MGHSWISGKVFFFSSFFSFPTKSKYKELFGSFSKRRKKFIEKAKKKGFHFVAKNPKPKRSSKVLVDGGLVILSKLPIVESDFIKFKKGMQSDALAG